MQALFRPLVRLPHHAALRWSSSFHPSAPAPAPPRLPAKEQAEFERLQKMATSQIMDEETTPEPGEELPRIPTRTPVPEFEGDKNPRTGEVNGPKSEPLRWGSKGDWSYNGRVTDF